LNNFSITLEARRFEAAAKTGRLELVGNTERFLFHLAEKRGTINIVKLFSGGREFAAPFAGSTETDRQIEVRFEK